LKPINGYLTEPRKIYRFVRRTYWKCEY